MSGAIREAQVAIQHLDTVDGPSGEPSSTWLDLVTLWAKIDDMTGRQYIAASATQNPVITRIRIRYRPGITPSMRVIEGADIYDIDAVLGQDRRWLDLMCTRGINRG